VGDSVLRHQAGSVATITLNRPEARNALTYETKVSLLDALRDRAGDESIRALIITGAGTAFCAGRTCASTPTCGSTAARSTPWPSITTRS